MPQSAVHKHPAIRKILDPLVPPLCPLCYHPVEEDHTLCAACWPKVDFISAPFCYGCGQPLECAALPHILCGRCLKDPFPFEEARSVFYYNPTVRPLILRFKYADATYLAASFARWMSWDQRYLKDVDAVVPVPLHWRRLWRRGFNQAALLAKEISHHIDIPFLPHALKRIKSTPSQGTLSKEQRTQNLRRAFVVPEKERTHIQGKTILLVDDVMASGATLRFCADALLTAGAKRVKVKVVCKSTI